MDIETKLRRFSDVVIKEAEEAKKKQVSLIDEKYETNIKEYEQKAESKYAEMLEDAAISAEKQKQKQIAQRNAELKKELIQKRKQYIDSIFENVQIRLADYFKTGEYEQLIAEYIESYKGAAESEDITAYVMKRDMVLKTSLEKRTGVTVFESDEDFLGGVKILLGSNKVADCTLRHRFEREKAGFNKIRII